MRAFGQDLLDLRRTHPGKDLRAWISDAYRLTPVMQIEVIDGRKHVNRCDVFGGVAFQHGFIAAIVLMTWIVVNIERTIRFSEYSDDPFAPALAQLMGFCALYAKSLQTPQSRLLSLWDKVGIPHKGKKQLPGSGLTTICISFDTSELRFTLPEQARVDLTNELDAWCDLSA